MLVSQRQWKSQYKVARIEEEEKTTENEPSAEYRGHVGQELSDKGLRTKVCHWEDFKQESHIIYFHLKNVTFLR